MTETLGGLEGAAAASDDAFPEDQSLEPTRPALRDHRETADGYAGELFRSGRYRVAECREGLQWLLQRKRPRKSPGGAAWDTLAYCVTRRALARLHRSLTDADAPEIAALPEVIKWRAKP